MEESRLRQQNPRNPGPISDPSLQKPPPPILERFKSLLKQLQDQIRRTSTNGDDDPRPTMDEIVSLYEGLLSELTYNFKPVITDLTIIAGDLKEYGEGIADAICRRIVEVPAEQKLPSLYLLDSIVKNIGKNYVRYFATRLSEVFCEAYKQVQPSQFAAMRHLFETWSTVFPPSTLRQIETELQFSSSTSHQTSGWAASRTSESPSPRPSHGIHVNPKYLEARHQFERSTVDVRNEKSSSSKIQLYGQKSTAEYAEHDLDHADVFIPPQTASRSASSASGSERPLALKTKGSGASSVRGIGQARSLSPQANGFMRDISPGIDERASPSHSAFPYNLGRVIDCGGNRSKSWGRNWSDGESQQIETSRAYSLGNELEHRGPKALIDAYGNYRGKGSLQEKLPRVEGLDVNGNNKSASRTWQNSEEEEYEWEDMSPTLADRSKGNDLIPSDSLIGNLSTRANLKRPNRALLEPEFRSNSYGQAQLSQLARGSFGMNSLNSTITQNGSLPHYQGSYKSREPWNLSSRPQYSNPYLLPQSRGPALQMPFSASQEISPLDSNVEIEAPLRSFSIIQSRMGNSDLDTSNTGVVSSTAPTSTMGKHLAQRSSSPPITSIGPLPPNPLPPSVNNSLPQHAQFDLLDVNRLAVNHGSNNSSILSRPQLDAADGRNQNSSKLRQFSRQQLLSSVQLPSQERTALTPASASHLVAQPLNHGPMQRQGTIQNMTFSNAFPGISSSSVIIHSIPGASFRSPAGALPPLPPGPPPVTSQVVPTSQNTGSTISHRPPGSAFSGLIGSLVAQGLISLTAPVVPQDSVGLEFNPELLKVRHESAINALYADLPRQCTTCGQRFKSKEEHSNHMDWHVTKNRMSKNRKQNPSRKWFVSAKEWFSGAEALGTDSVPGFLPTEAVVEKREDEELAVPADENQNVCALCGEPFDDFYSDETEEWMYKGAVYLNVQDGLTEFMDKSQRGPIVHAKCRSESTIVPMENFKQNEEGINEDIIQRKRMRV